VVRVCWRSDEDTLEQAILIGHFSRAARFTNCSHIPVLNLAWKQFKADSLLRHSAFYRREIRTLFDRIPNRFLLSTHVNDWLSPLKQIVDLSNPLKAVTHWLPGLEGNMGWLLVTLFSDRFGPTILQRILFTLADQGLTVHGHESLGMGAHRLIFISIEKPDAPMDMQALNQAVSACIIFWKDRAKAAVLKQSQQLDIPRVLNTLQHVPELYQQVFSPEQFAHDILMCRTIEQHQRINVVIQQHSNAIVIDIYAPQQPSLGDVVDRLRAFGLDPAEEAAMRFGDAGQHALPSSCMYISRISCHPSQLIDGVTLDRLQQALDKVMNLEADHDMLNACVLTAGLDIQAVAVLVTLRNHLVQLLPQAAALTLSETMLRYPLVTACLYQMFAVRHDIRVIHSPQQADQAFAVALQKIENISDDRWFRILAELVTATLRSNAYSRSADMPLAIKVASGRLSFAPHPRPYREIFMHGIHVEGVHLRAGPIARGGIRYSDRPSDFRTEVLELMRTQTIKNGQIVPTGSKGGFVLHNIAAEAVSPAVVLEQYRLFIRTLLALTDNRLHDQSLPPDGVCVAEDDIDDAYLVVAADKGTARFSDDANEESRLAGFWLDDAFASGGKDGYDHKVVGITARGAWVCAAHHFHRLSIDAWNDSINCVGIGDMSGDVFGNGMLLNPNLRLLAAFNHQHIFLDPEPETAAAFAERQRLFQAVRGWGDYDQSLISKSGGIFSRHAKAITISEPVRQWLGLSEQQLSGPELVQAILKAPVDLLYNGGIGTYVKAGWETHDAVMDRANDSVRVDASQLRCKVVCEGGNLGFTQGARIEFSQHVSPMINTDATDNSGGVDMSDHEVNLKILFAAQEQPMPVSERNRILKSLTDQVTLQCLDNNLLQSRVITLASHDAETHASRLQRLRDALLAAHWLDPEVAPRIEDNDLLVLRPQISILLGQEKNRIHHKLITASFDTRSRFSSELLRRYFPPALHRKMAACFDLHPLRADIICTQASNDIVNQHGLVAIQHLESLVDAPMVDIAESLLLAAALTDAADLRQAIWSDVSDFEVAVSFQHQLQETQLHLAEELLRLCSVSEQGSDWLPEVHKAIHRFRKSKTAQGISGNENNRFLGLLKHAAQEGLSLHDATHLAALPELAELACALYLSMHHQQALLACIKATQSCLQQLPIPLMEEQLRSASWGGEDAHNLRREWLQRLTLLKCRAAQQVLEAGHLSAEQAAKELWHCHHFWPDIDRFIVSQKADRREGESQHLRLLLALTRLEAIVNAS